MAAEKEGLTPAADPRRPVKGPTGRRRFGDRGEDLAAAFFMSKGFRVVDRNWSCRLGEIDLVVEGGGVTHFVEVKTRRTLTYGRPEEAITRNKLDHLAKAIESYLRCHTVKDYQADALAITLMPGEKPQFHYVENIL